MPEPTPADCCITPSAAATLLRGRIVAADYDADAAAMTLPRRRFDC